MAHKIISGILALIFLVFAVAQFNDPDGLTWVLAYGFVALIAVIYVWKGRSYLPILIPAFLLYLFFSFFYWPAASTEWWKANEMYDSLDMQMPFIEEGREALGLLLCALVMGYYIILAVRKKQSRIATY